MDLGVEVRMSGVDDPAAEGRDPCSRAHLVPERQRHETLVDLYAEHARRRPHLQHIAGELRRIVVVLVAPLPRVRIDARVRRREQALVLRVGDDVVLPVEAERMREPDVPSRQAARVLRGNDPAGQSDCRVVEGAFLLEALVVDRSPLIDRRDGDVLNRVALRSASSTSLDRGRRAGRARSGIAFRFCISALLNNPVAGFRGGHFFGDGFRVNAAAGFFLSFAMVRPFSGAGRWLRAYGATRRGRRG